jgi:uncharacterized membrane protein
MWDYAIRNGLRRPLLTLAGASVLGTVLLGTRVVLTQRFTHLFLVWNMILAWIPLCLAMRIDDIDERQPGGTWRFWATALAWLMFFPNAPYIFTDLKHLRPVLQSRWWTDLILILFFALIGLVLAFLSLHRMQRVVARRRGIRSSWAFVSGVMFLSGFGVYLGRFGRWNTWDVLINPIPLLVGSVNSVHGQSAKFTILFGLFLLTSYLLLYSLTSLPAPIRERADE